jgi:hypothetical protein
MRPVILTPGLDWRNWENLVSSVKTFKEQDDWKSSKNQVMALRQVLRDGPQAVLNFLIAHPSTRTGKPRSLFEIPGYPESANTGWIGRRCTCFDAIEMMDFYVKI